MRNVNSVVGFWTDHISEKQFVAPEFGNNHASCGKICIVQCIAHHCPIREARWSYLSSEASAAAYEIAVRKPPAQHLQWNRSSRSDLRTLPSSRYHLTTLAPPRSSSSHVSGSAKRSADAPHTSVKKETGDLDAWRVIAPGRLNMPALSANHHVAYYRHRGIGVPLAWSHLSDLNPRMNRMKVRPIVLSHRRVRARRGTITLCGVKCTQPVQRKDC